jgi:glycine oxidase
VGRVVSAVAERADVAVVGGGVIGLSVAWKIACAGLRTRVFDPDPCRGASWAAAGMLAPVTEHTPGEEALLELGQASLDRWPTFAAELEADADAEVGLRDEGTLVVGFDDDDRRVLGETAGVHRRLGLQSEWLTRRQCRELEPTLAPRVTGGLLASGDRSVDNRALLGALHRAAERRGVAFDERAVGRVARRADRARGVELVDGERFDAGAVVVAAGAWSGSLDGLAPGADPPVRPVKGEILRLRGRADEPVARATIRATVQGWGAYLVPRRSGELVLGATMQEAGFDVGVRAGAVFELLRAATTVVPAVGELELVEALARSRPTTPDNGPVIGPTPVEGLHLATGHHRNGILLAPITADAIESALLGQPLTPVVRCYSGDRFR